MGLKGGGLRTFPEILLSFILIPDTCVLILPSFYFCLSTFVFSTMHRLNLSRPVVFFDLETTGVDVAKDRIIEIALIRIYPDGARDSLVRRVNPGMPISPGAYAVHGICDDDLKSSPRFEELAEMVFQYFQGCDLGGYNITAFDLPVLAEEFLRAGITPDFSACHVIDAQQIFFKKEKRTLEAALQFYCGKTLENAHSAEADTLAVIDVLLGQLERYEDLCGSVERLHHYCKAENAFIDYARRLVRQGEEVCYNFGKHKGKSVREILAKEPGYHQWVIASDFPLYTKHCLQETVDALRKPVAG